MKRSEEKYENNYDNFNNALIENFKATSRTARGSADISVSEKKKGPKITGKELTDQAGKNFKIISEYIWKNRNKEILDTYEIS